MPVRLSTGSRRCQKTKFDQESTDADDFSAHGTQQVDADAAAEELKSAPWRALFFFTTKANIPSLILGIFFAFSAGVMSPAQSLIMGKVFDGFTSYARGTLDRQTLMNEEKKYIYYLLAIGGGSWLFHFLFFFAWLAFGELQAKSARDRLFHGLLEKDIEWYDMRKNGIGALLPRLQVQIRELQLATSQPLGEVFLLGSTSLLCLGQAFYYSWKLTLVTLASSPFILAVVVWLGGPVQTSLERQNEKLAEAQKYVTNALSAIETVKCFNGMEVELSRYKQLIAEAAVHFYKVANANALQFGFVVLLATSMFVQGFYYGGILIGSGQKTIAQVITCFLSAIGGFQALQGVLLQLVVLEKGRAAGATLRTIMAQVQHGSAVLKSRAQLAPTTCLGSIDVQNVSFAYPSRPDLMAIRDLTLYIPAGEMTFLIGRSGSGKSTLGQLLMRFYPCAIGSITLDELPLELLDVNWLRTHITLVEQQSQLFNDTVFRNIAFGQHDNNRVSKREVMEAAEFALLQLMINDMPDGLDTLVGYKGDSMSGGQRQRMALARARLRDTPILLLDESTSALDHISRALMMEAIRAWRTGKTTIIITHDISQILADDYVYVLEHGRLVQEGCRKHMEKLKDTPFQGFLPKEEQATLSPYDSRKDTGSKSIRTEASLNSMALLTRPADTTRDPLDAPFDAGETNRMSFLPAALMSGGVIPVVKPYGKAGPTSAFASPFLRWVVSPPSPNPTQSNRSSGSSVSHAIETSSRSQESTALTKRWPQARAELTEWLLHTTGQQAVDSRLKSLRVRQRTIAKPLETPQLQSDLDTPTAKPPVPNFERGVEQSKSITAIMGTLWANIDWRARAVMFLGFYGATINAVASPLFAYILSKLLETYSVTLGGQEKSLIYSISILMVALADATHTYMMRFFLEYVGQVWVDNIRVEGYNRILDQPRDFFTKEENSVARLAESLDRNAEEMQAIVGRFAGQIYIAVVMSAMAITWALATQWKMTLIALSAGPYVFITTNVFAAISGKWEALTNDASADVGAIFTEIFTNIRTVRALTLESHFLDKYIKATNNAQVIGFQRAFYSGFFYGLSESAGTFSTALIFYLGAKLVIQNVPVADVIQVFTMLIFTIAQVSSILNYIPQMGSSKDMGSRLLQLSQLPQDSHEHLGDIRIKSIGNIIFNNLSFSYPSRPEHQILRSLNLCIRPGTSTALVGASGSGKSTIASLLLNLYATPKLPAGENDALADLTFAGRDIKHIHTPSLRSLVTIVSQTPTLLSANVLENIVYGLPTSSPYKNLHNVQAAAAQAGIADFIESLPLGYSTLVGEGGMGLSGGQAQRVAIARALVRRPAVLILDEATSALDVRSAELIRQTIMRLVNDRKRTMTVVIITHSEDMMAMAENIVVLDEGQVVEVGGFGELLAKRGALANLLSGGEWMGNRTVENKPLRRGPIPVLKNVNWHRRSTGSGRQQG